mmetsp:Transcript_84637/g.226210  ORF Transcript_84637/g.226210 Transcript_84637/m.226210 type:complete len:204 (-) Transcript_84637:2768-3379(-)
MVLKDPLIGLLAQERNVANGRSLHLTCRAAGGIRVQRIAKHCPVRNRIGRVVSDNSKCLPGQEDTHPFLPRLAAKKLLSGQQSHSPDAGEHFGHEVFRRGLQRWNGAQLFDGQFSVRCGLQGRHHRLPALLEELGFVVMFRCSRNLVEDSLVAESDIARRCSDQRPLRLPQTRLCFRILHKRQAPKEEPSSAAGAIEGSLQHC